MTDQVSGAAPAAPQSPVASIKAFLTAQSAPPTEPDAPQGEAEPSGGVALTQSEAPERATAPKEPATREDEGAAEQVDDAETVESDDPPEGEQLSSFEDLTEASGLDLDTIMSWALPTKVDGKEGTATLRDLVRSYQLDQHISKKLESLDTDRKTFESRRAETEKAAQERLAVLENGVAVLSQALEGDFASVDWAALQKGNPAAFNAKYVEYQQRFAQMQNIAQQIEAGKKQQNEFRSAQAKAWADEQETLLKAKIPEWSDDKRRAQDRVAIAEYLKGYGITQAEFDEIQDHRVAMVLRDAHRWAELQKQKPVTLKKVKAAPKLLKPGSKQSRESREGFARKEDMARLSRSGKVGDAARVVKGILGAKR
jgi:hypothetical protein